MNKKYFSMVTNAEKKEANLTIYGDITSWPWEELGEVSATNLSKQLEELADVDIINVHISSYGGEVKEGLAIYNALRNHKAKIRTYCDGFACSIASVIFMAGEERFMSEASLLMIHNAWSRVVGNAQELRKQADDLDKITQASINAYMKYVNISEEELKDLLDSEYWLTYDEAIEKGFATSVIEEKTESVSQSVKKTLLQMILENQSKFVKQEDLDKDKATDTEVKETSEEPENQESTSTEDTDTDDNLDSNDEEDLQDVSTDEDGINDEEDDEKPTEKMVDFFVAMIGGMKE